MHSFNPKWAENASSKEPALTWFKSEIHVLSALLSNWSDHSETLGWSGLQFQIEPEHFQTDEARFFYSVMLSMRDRGLACDDVTIFFEEVKKVSTAKPDVIMKACLPFLDVTTTNVNYWARNVLDGYLHRELEKALAAMVENRSDETRSRVMTLEDSIQKLKESEAFGDRKFTMLHHGIVDFMDLLEERLADAGKGIQHLSSGYPSLDAKLKFGRGHFIVIGGRSGMGKTAFGINLMQRMASAGNKIAFFSLEHKVFEVMQALVAIEASVSHAKFDEPIDMDSDDWDRIAESARRMLQQNVAISNKPGSTVADIKGELEGMRRTMGGLDAIFIDHMHVIGDDRNFKSPREKLMFITAQFKAIASYFDVPLISLAQMNRDSDKRTEKRPQVSDLKESGSIEQDADAILFVYRDSYYSGAGYESEKKGMSIASAVEGPGGFSKGSMNPFTEVICKKNRHGSFQNFTLYFDFNSKIKKFNEATSV